MVGEILFVLIGGVVIGLLGKFVAPGNRDNIPLWLTVVCGVLGIFLGTFLYVDLLGGRAEHARRRLAAPPDAGARRGRPGRDRLHDHRPHHLEALTPPSLTRHLLGGVGGVSRSW